jgi:hypothetical protein
VISRAQRILFAVLLISVVAMAAILIRLRERAQDRLHTVQDSTPLIEDTAEAAPQPITLVIPNDVDGSLAEAQRSLALPADDSTKARVLLEALIESFRDPHSTHPISPIPENESAAANPGSEGGINDVYLMPVPHAAGAANAGTMAVVDFSAAFAASHPSGIEPETLTLLSILGTLHANLPAITEVRFLIDGHPAETLAGHADLTRTYLTAETTTGTPSR